MQQASVPALNMSLAPFQLMAPPPTLYTSYGSISNMCSALACQGVAPLPAEAAAVAAAAEATVVSDAQQFPTQSYHPLLQAPSATTDSGGSKRRRVGESSASASQQSGATGPDGRGGLYFIDRYLGGTTGHASRSGRCAVCLVQRKGRCGTKSAPLTCLRVQAYQAKGMEVPEAPPKMIRRRESEVTTAGDLLLPPPQQPSLQFAPPSPAE
jgi:hypothetical protein